MLLHIVHMAQWKPQESNIKVKPNETSDLPGMERQTDWRQRSEEGYIYSVYFRITIDEPEQVSQKRAQRIPSHH